MAEIKTLNCTSCGAPISVPDNVDRLNCGSCGSFLAVQRGEGYVALKMVEHMTAAIKEEGISTRSELKAMQLTNEISMLELQLNSIRGEIRGLARSVSDQDIPAGVRRQIFDLHFQEYQLLERLRTRHLLRASLSVEDPDLDLDILISQLEFVEEEIRALDRSDLNNREIMAILTTMETKQIDLADKIHRLKVARLKSNLRSYKPGTRETGNIEEVKKQLSDIHKDIQVLNAMPKTREVQVLLKDLREKQDTLQDRWSSLEEERISAALTSGSIHPPYGQDLMTIEKQLSQVHADISLLQGWEKNYVSQRYLDESLRKERKLSKHYNKLRRKQERAMRKSSGGVTGFMGFLTGLGLGSILGSQATREKSKPELRIKKPDRGKEAEPSATPLVSPEAQTSQAVPVESAVDSVHADSTPPAVVSFDSEVQQTRTVPEILTPASAFRSRILRSCLIAFVALVVFGCGAIALAISIELIRPQEETSPFSTNIILIGIFLGYAVGTWLFFRRLVPGGDILGYIFSDDLESRTLFGLLFGTSGTVGAAFLFMTISIIASNNDAVRNLMMSGFLLSPLVGLVMFLIVKKPNAALWSFLRNRIIPK